MALPAFLAGAFFVVPDDFAAFLAGAAFLSAAFFPDDEFNSFLNAWAGAKRTPLAAAIFTGVPVCGLRPIRAAREVGLKMPNPEIDTLFPALTSLITAPNNAFSAASAVRRSTPASSLTRSTSSDLFTATSWRNRKNSFQIKEECTREVKHFHLPRKGVQNTLGARSTKSPLFARLFATDELSDGTYDVIVIDVDERDASASRVELVVTSGARKGETVALTITGSRVDALSAIGMPGTLTVVDGAPRLDLERA